MRDTAIAQRKEYANIAVSVWLLSICIPFELNVPTSYRVSLRAEILRLYYTWSFSYIHFFLAHIFQTGSRRSLGKRSADRKTRELIDVCSSGVGQRRKWLFLQIKFLPESSLSPRISKRNARNSRSSQKTFSTLRVPRSRYSPNLSMTST